MKITAIQTKNFIGARDVDVTITKPICLFAGKNFSGKSSLAEAVRMALTGESVRVSLKKDYAILVSDGADVGYAVVEHDGQRSAIAIPSGAHDQTAAIHPYLLPFVLDAQRFSALDANARRQFLFGLMGLRTDSETISARMLDKGCDALKVDEIRPHLRAGFDAAHKEAQSKARDAKAAWRAITGETYGSVKAQTWQSTKPAHDGSQAKLAREELASAVKNVEQCVVEIAVMQSAAMRQAQQSDRIASLRERSKRYASIAAKLQKDEAALKEWQAKVEAEERLAGGKQMPTEPTYSCPSCGVVLRHDHASGAMVIFTAPPVVYPSEPGNLAKYRNARDLLARSVDNDKRDLADADLAAKTLAEIEDDKSDQAPLPEEIDARKDKLSEARKEQTRLTGAVKALEADERAAAVADEKTDAARGHHRDVARWEDVAAALAPSGIPGELLAEALEPINERLLQSAEIAEWSPVDIQTDMSIVSCVGGVGGVKSRRPYALLSESERWRADAMIAEAVSHISGVRLMVLDRVDLLDLAGREDLLYWLDGLAADGEIDTCLLFGTLKALPANLPEMVEAFWLENGTAGQVREAA